MEMGNQGLASRKFFLRPRPIERQKMLLSKDSLLLYVHIYIKSGSEISISIKTDTLKLKAL